MGMEHGPLRRTKIGAFVAVLVLALSVPGIAFALNTATFRNMTPVKGSSSTVVRPLIAATVWDKYGVTAMPSMKLDGTYVRRTLTRIGSGLTRFRLSYQVVSALSLGSHEVTIRVKDRRGRISRITWTFTVVGSGVPGAAQHALPVSVCTNSGCHGTVSPFGDPMVGTLPLIHKGACYMCHAVGMTPINNCMTCHGQDGGHGEHDVIPSTSDPACTTSTCHGTAALTIHSSCAVCHSSTSATVIAAIASDHATCESCHTATFAVLHASAAGKHTATDPTCSTASNCHSRDVTVIHSTWARNPGCAACHAAGVTPSLRCENCHQNIHNFTHANATGALSSACTECHGTDLPAVHEKGELPGCFCHTNSLFNMNKTMKPLMLAGRAECVDCHKGPYAAHDFSGTASGHNTTTYGKKGGYTKWDGSEGVVVKDSTGATITQEWPLPPSGVFWSDSRILPKVGGGSLNPTDAPAVAMANRGGTDMASKINTTVKWDSVITCQDCHTGLDASMGPHGANEGQVALDPNFPDDWTKAEITSFDPTGMRSIATTAGTANPYYAKLGSKVWPPPDSASGTTGTVANVWKNGANVGTATVADGGFYATTSTSSNGYSSGAVTGRFICQKCHKLTNSYQGLGIEGNARGLRSNNFNYMGFSNEAHMEHHADMITGQANCVSCHIAIPHGWKRPRLLVYESDPAPYKVQWVFPGYQDLALAKSPTADLSNGNWGYVGTSGTSTYKLIGAAIPNGVANGQNGIDASGTVIDNTGKTYSSHLEKVAASSTALKELVVGPATHFQVNDTANGTTWGLWDFTKTGSEWEPDTSPNALYSDEAIQNNCTGCTSAGLTHSDTGGSSEGVADSPSRSNTPIPFWK